MRMTTLGNRTKITKTNHKQQKGNNKIMYSKTLQELIAFFDNQIRVCCEYADNSESEDEFEFWRAERFTMRAYRNYIRFCVL